MRRSAFHLLAVIAILSSCSAAGQSKMGRISGVVLNEVGRPIRDAQVTAQFSGAAIMHTVVRTVKSDVHGRFTIDRLAWGPYELYAGKEADGYPNTLYTLNRTQPVPKVVLSPKHANAKTVVKLGRRGGSLTLVIREAASHRPLPGQVTLRRVDSSGMMTISVPAQHTFVLPPQINISLAVEHKGYKPWTYSEDSRAYLNLLSGQKREVVVDLLPESQ